MHDDGLQLSVRGRRILVLVDPVGLFSGPMCAGATAVGGKSG